MFLLDNFYALRRSWRADVGGAVLVLPAPGLNAALIGPTGPSGSQSMRMRSSGALTLAAVRWYAAFGTGEFIVAEPVNWSNMAMSSTAADRPNPVKIKSRYFAGAFLWLIKAHPMHVKLTWDFRFGSLWSSIHPKRRKWRRFFLMHNLITERTPAAPWWCMNAGVVRARVFSLGGVSRTRVVQLG